MADIAAARDRLETAADKLEIQEVLMRYCRGLDRADIAVLRSVYHEDAWSDHGPYDCPAHEFCDYVLELLDTLEICRHDITNTIIELDGDTAQSEAYFLAIQRERGSGYDDYMAGRYLDRFERRGGVWRIAHRRVVLDWSRKVAYSRDNATVYDPIFPQGRRDELDPLYQPAGD